MRWNKLYMGERKKTPDIKDADLDKFVLDHVADDLLKKIIPGFDPLKRKYGAADTAIIGWVWGLPTVEAIEEYAKTRPGLMFDLNASIESAREAYGNRKTLPPELQRKIDLIIDEISQSPGDSQAEPIKKKTN